MVSKSSGPKKGIGGSGAGGGGVGGDGEIVIELQPLIDKLCELLGEGDETLFSKICELIATLVNEEGVTAIDKLCQLVDLFVNEAGETALDKLCDILEALVSDEGESAIDKLCAILDALVNEDGDTAIDKLCELVKKSTSAPILWGVRVDTNFVDNHSEGEPPYGIVAYPIDDHNIVLNLSDGSTCDFDIPATGAGTYPAWNDALAASIALCTGKPWVRAANPADGDPTTPVGNHAASPCCPGDLTVVSATATVTSETRNGRVIPLLTGVTEGELEKFLQFICLGQPDVWTDLDGNVVEKPDLTCAAVNCQFPAANPCGCPKPADCIFETFQGCLIQNPEDEETGAPEVAQQNVFQRFETCDGVTTIVTLTVEDGDESPLEVAENQYFGDCETLLPPNYEPPCPEDCDWTPMSLVEHHAVWDNTRYKAPDTAAVKAGDTLEFEFGDGSFQQLDITGNSLFQTKAFFESLGCTVKVHCDNWVINGEDRCLRFPAWPTGKTKCADFAALTIDDAYAAYLIITHCDPSKLPVNTTIIASDREEVVGATHHSVHCMTSEMVTACYKCSGTIVKNCDDQIIEVDPKCLMAPKTQVCDVDLLALLASMKVIKSGGIEGANYDGAFAFTSGRPDPNVSWAVIDNNDPNNQSTIIYGDTLAEFSADAESKGYTQFIVGEIHYLCPCPADMPAVATGNYFVEAGGDTVVKPGCTPLAELEGAPVKLPAESHCALRVLDCNSDAILACLLSQKVTITECCTGGATETTAKCANISASWTRMSLGDFDSCTASFGGIALPDDNYTYEDFEALILGVGGTIEPNPNNPTGSYTICVPDGFRTCYDKACFKDRIGQLTRACVVSTDNTTEPECITYQRTWGKYEEPIANILTTSLDVQQGMLDKLCQMLEGDDMGTAKLCLIEDALTGVCPQEVLVLDKELQTLTIAGDVTENYATTGQNIDLQNANGESCGGATVASPAVLNEAGDTVITLEECELDEGKEPVQITQAKPVAVATVRAIKTVKTLTAVKLARDIIVKEPVKEETPTRG